MPGRIVLPLNPAILDPESLRGPKVAAQDATHKGWRYISRRNAFELRLACLYQPVIPQSLRPHVPASPSTPLPHGRSSVCGVEGRYVRTHARRHFDSVVKRLYSVA